MKIITDGSYKYSTISVDIKKKTAKIRNPITGKPNRKDRIRDTFGRATGITLFFFIFPATLLLWICGMFFDQSNNNGFVGFLLILGIDEALIYLLACYIAIKIDPTVPIRMTAMIYLHTGDKKEYITDELDSNEYKLESFRNIYLQCDMTGDFKRYLIAVDVKPNIGSFNNVTDWYAEIKFSKTPKNGEMHLTYV